ncbi:MAG: PAS domain-containing protein [Planctomycetales bacterium]|nr:MAG: PAS domain-containing protein [Planctomycetales bacterium]
MPLSRFNLTFERLMEEISEGISISDPSQPDNPLVFVNSAFCRLSGYSDEEVLGKNCRFLQGPGTDQAQMDILRKALREAKPCVVEILNYRKDGSEFWNSLSISPVTDADGSLRFFIGVQTDITRRRQLEERQRQFVGDMAHELKTPLAAILGLTETLKRQPAMEDGLREEIYTSLLSQSERLHLTVNDILDISRLNSMASITSMQLISLEHLLGEVLEGFLPQAKLAGISLDCSIEKGSFVVMGDPWSLGTLIGNLLSNALKYSPSGSQVAVELKHDEGQMLSLSVTDNGPGIAEEHCKHIFERFYRVEASRSRDKGGTGLGLAIVQEVATRHGGHVLLESELGRGSRFTVKLPVR